MRRCLSSKQVGCKRGNTAFPRQVVAEKRDGSNVRLYSHNRTSPSSPLFVVEIAAVDGFQRQNPSAYAALTRVLPTKSVPSRRFRSATSWQWTQRGAQGTAARRFELIASPHEMQ